jgi:hypothetical protein
MTNIAFSKAGQLSFIEFDKFLADDQSDRGNEGATFDSMGVGESSRSGLPGRYSWSQDVSDRNEAWISGRRYR